MNEDHEFQLKLHALITARSIPLLDEQWRSRTDEAILQEVVSYYRRMVQASGDIITHEEPLYVAGAICGLSDAEVNTRYAVIRNKYVENYAEVSDRANESGLDYIPDLHDDDGYTKVTQPF